MKYSEKIKQLVGYVALVSEENGFCKILVTGNMTLSTVAGLGGSQRFEIQQVHEDFVVLHNGNVELTYPTNAISLTIVPAVNS